MVFGIRRALKKGGHFFSALLRTVPSIIYFKIILYVHYPNHYMLPAFTASGNTGIAPFCVHTYALTCTAKR